MSIPTTRIQSVNNIRLSTLRKDEQLLFFEGKKLSNDILSKLGVQIELLIIHQDHFEQITIPYPEQVRDIWLVSSQVMAKVSELKSIPPVIAVTRYIPQKLHLNKCRSLLALLEVQDPGNVGTLIRTACAFGFDGVAQVGPSVRLSNRKLIRAAQNSIHQIPIHSYASFSEFIAKCRRNHITIYLSSADPRQNSLGPEEMIPPCAIVVGNEGFGFSSDILSQYPSVRIPQVTSIDSLNVSVSGCILMHELRKKWGYE